jgi:hypothetical protein
MLRVPIAYVVRAERDVVCRLRVVGGDRRFSAYSFCASRACSTSRCCWTCAASVCATLSAAAARICINSRTSAAAVRHLWRLTSQYTDPSLLVESFVTSNSDGSTHTRACRRYPERIRADLHDPMACHSMSKHHSVMREIIPTPPPRRTCVIVRVSFHKPRGGRNLQGSPLGGS